RNHSLTVRVAGLVSNRSGVGAKVEMRAGSLRQKLETYAATPNPAPADLVFGLGPRPAADAVRVLWPAGILQTEMGDEKKTALLVKELDRKPSSCPYLYAWNGERFAFVTDFMGGGEMGYWEGPGEWNHPDPDEYVRLTDEQLRPRDGRCELRVTDELAEGPLIHRLDGVCLLQRQRGRPPGRAGHEAAHAAGGRSPRGVEDGGRGRHPGRTPPDAGRRSRGPVAPGGARAHRHQHEDLLGPDPGGRPRQRARGGPVAAPVPRRSPRARLLGGGQPRRT